MRNGLYNWRRRVMLPLAVLVIPAALVFWAVTALAATDKATALKPVVITTRKLPKLGNVLVNTKGRTLYMFVPDKHKKVTCTGGCAVAWPPLKLPSGAKAVAKGKAKSSLIGSDRDPSGGRVVTYHGWPLYSWVGDRAAGKATGQALDANGGYWYVLSPSGEVIRKRVTLTPTRTGAKATVCPKGETIAEASPIGDNDADNSPSGPDDHDGCL